MCRGASDQRYRNERARLQAVVPSGQRALLEVDVDTFIERTAQLRLERLAKCTGRLGTVVGFESLHVFPDPKDNEVIGATCVAQYLEGHDTRRLCVSAASLLSNAFEFSTFCGTFAFDRTSMIVTTVMLPGGDCAQAALESSMTSVAIARKVARKSFDIILFLRYRAKA